VKEKYASAFFHEFSKIAFFVFETGCVLMLKKCHGNKTMTLRFASQKVFFDLIDFLTLGKGYGAISARLDQPITPVSNSRL